MDGEAVPLAADLHEDIVQHGLRADRDAAIRSPFGFGPARVRGEDAEQQRARLAMMGYEAKVTEREQSGRTMFRVRIGPYDRKDDADGTKEKLAGVGVEAALVRVQK